MYVDELKKELSTKKTSERNPRDTPRKSKVYHKKGYDKKNNPNELQKITYTIGLKLYYIRYANEWLIGVWGSKNIAITTRTKIEIFLKEKLYLNILLEKTRVIHTRKEKAQFLGYEIYLSTPKELGFSRRKIKKRASHATIRIDAPYKKLKEQLIDKKILVEKNGKWLVNAVTHWLNYSHSEILYRYNSIIRAYLFYYSHVNNLCIFNKLIGFVLRQSCAVTLGRKLKLRSRRKVFRKFGKNLKEPTTQLALAIPSNFIANVKNYNE